MYRLIVTALFLFGFSQAGLSAVIQGKMSCSIVDQAIVDITDGNPQRFDATRGGARVGDAFLLQYKLATDGTRENIIFMLGKGESGDGSPMDINNIAGYNLVNAELKRYQSEYGDFFTVNDSSGSSGDRELVISADFFIIFNGETKFQRYASDRWMGMSVTFVRGSNSIYSKTLSFDCKNMNPGSFTQIHKALINRNKNQ